MNKEELGKWRSVELPGCEGQGTFALETGSDEARLFDPVLRGGERARERIVRVTHGATSGVTVTYTVELANGQQDTARIVFF